jgi:hypothetical protein
MEDTEVQEEVAEEVTEDGVDGDEEGKDSKIWFPYITKAQFEKFLSRLQTKIPDEIDRDYIRAIIRTPSMIYRFLRGIEAMKLIDRDQKPTDRLANLVNESSRQKTITEILQDLYPELLTQYRSSGSMVDREVVTFFRRETGMGNDSANKMKMFFKYLLSESDLNGAALAAAVESEEEEEQAEPAAAERRPTQQRASRPSRQAQQAESSRSERGGDRVERVERAERGAPPSRTLSESQRAYLDTLKSVLSVNIDGDWDDDMIKLAFDRLERLFERVRRG